MDFDIDQITQDDGFIHVYTDGSYSSKNKKTGSSWVTATQNIKEPIINAVANDDDSLLNSLIDPALYAEFRAVEEALNNAPDHANIRIHTDNRSVFFILNGILSSGHIEPQKMQILDNVISGICKSFDRLGKVDITQSNDNNSEKDPLKRYYMTLAHNASCDASGSRNIKYVPSPFNEEFTNNAKPPKHVINDDSSDAMDIIDLGGKDDSTHPFDPRYQKPPGKNKPNF